MDSLLRISAWPAVISLHGGRATRIQKKLVWRLVEGTLQLACLVLPPVEFTPSLIRNGHAAWWSWMAIRQASQQALLQLRGTNVFLRIQRPPRIEQPKWLLCHYCMTNRATISNRMTNLSQIEWLIYLE
jgi:hypothetical protein